MNVTINNINKALVENELPFEIVKGNGYFYFAALEAAPMGSEDYVKSIWSCQLRCMTVEKYVEHVQDGYNEYKQDI